MSNFSGDERLASTVLLVRDAPVGDGLEVWVQERVSEMPDYPGVTVFPGGGVDRRDLPATAECDLPGEEEVVWWGPSISDTAQLMGTTPERGCALVFAAIRELFEETGTLLVVDQDGTPLRDAQHLHHYRPVLENHKMSLTEMLRTEGLRADARLLRPWQRWVGRSAAGNSLDAYSFLAVLPAGQHPDDDTSEADSAGWFSPELIVEGWRAGLVRLVLPTWAQLRVLEECHNTREAMERAATASMQPHFASQACMEEEFAEFFSTHPSERI